MRSCLGSLVVVLFSMIGLMLPTAKASECAPFLGYCAYYECRDAELKCGVTDYFYRFGSHYCRAFDRELSKFSEHGLEVLSKIKSCLQVKLEAETSLTCENALDFAYRHHEGCYLSSGFCDMSLADKWIILSTVFPELEKSGFREVVINVGTKCAVRGPQTPGLR